MHGSAPLLHHTSSCKDRFWVRSQNCEKRLQAVSCLSLYAPLLSLIHATCPAYTVLLDLITGIIFGLQYTSLSSSLCVFSTPLLPRLPQAQIPSSTPYSRTHLGQIYVRMCRVRNGYGTGHADVPCMYFLRDAFMLQRDGLAPGMCAQRGPFSNRR